MLTLKSQHNRPHILCTTRMVENHLRLRKTEMLANHKINEDGVGSLVEFMRMEATGVNLICGIAYYDLK